jgi:hypothetical protein
MREVEMKLSSIVCASIVILAGVVFAADGALADPSVNYNASKSNTGNVTMGQTPTCPKEQAWDATSKKCVAASSVNYNSSKSRTGENVTATPLNNRQNLSGASQPAPTGAPATPPPK